MARGFQKRLLFMGLVGLAAGLMLASPSSAQNEPPPAAPTPSDDAVNLIAKNMYCPVCENVPLDVCPTVACQEWREEIKEKLALGWTEDEIYAYFELKYGDRVLAAPPVAGFNWILYAIPPLAIVFGLYVLVRALRARAAGATEGSQTAGRPVSSDADDEMLARLDAELKRRDR
jgi:cytochrome c-type biogenesis protein CcmH